MVDMSLDIAKRVNNSMEELNSAKSERNSKILA